MPVPTMAASRIKLGLIQMAVGENKVENIQKAISLIKKATENGSKVVALPECFNSPYGIQHFPKYAEAIPDGETSQALSAAAVENNIFLVGGSIPESDQGKLFNTCTVWNPEGKLVCKHRKVHLFDIDIPGGIQFKESEVLSPGNTLTTFNVGNVKVGLGICYDVRFGEMARLYSKLGCHLLLYPGAFNKTTGPLHWELLQRARAVDNELYVSMISPARVEGNGYVAYGYTMLVDPWGKTVASAETGEEIIYGEVDLDVVNQMRQQIPVLTQLRKDLYETVEK